MRPYCPLRSPYLSLVTSRELWGHSALAWPLGSAAKLTLKLEIEARSICVPPLLRRKPCGLLTQTSLVRAILEVLATNTVAAAAPLAGVESDRDRAGVVFMMHNIV